MKNFELYMITTDSDNKYNGIRLLGEFDTRRQLNYAKLQYRATCTTVAYAFGQFAGILNKRAA